MVTWHVVVPASMDAGWRWIEPENAGRGWRFRFHRGADVSLGAAAQAALNAAALETDAVIVTHDCPSARAVASLPTPAGQRRPFHLAMSFHEPRAFTPKERDAFRELAPRIDLFACHSRFECAYYAAELRVDSSRFAALPWYFDGSVAPVAGQTGAAEVQPAGRYLCAAGGSMRDYRTLFAAMALCPQQRLVAVVRPANLAGLSVPDNVSVLCDIPQARLWQILAHCAAHVLPLGADSRSGHTLLTQAMFLGVPTVVAEAACVDEYVRPGNTAETYRPGDADDLARAMDGVARDPQRMTGMAEAARAWAHAEFSKRRMGDRLSVAIRPSIRPPIHPPGEANKSIEKAGKHQAA